MDASSQHEEDHLEIKLQESSSTVIQLTHRIKKLQDLVNSLKESQDFRDLKTASCTGSTHASGKQVVFSEFFSQAWLCQPRFFHTQNLNCEPADVFEDPILKVSGTASLASAAQAAPAWAR